jgi:hypothetical protein
MAWCDGKQPDHGSNQQVFFIHRSLQLQKAPAPNPNYIGPKELIIPVKNLSLIIGPGGGVKIQDGGARIEKHLPRSSNFDLLSSILDHRPDHASPRGFTAQLSFSA